jgi:hypothetical protein
VRSQIYSHVEHALIAGCGGQWRNFNLVMFNAYIDDSGTAPSQRIAIASALIIPARRILALESEWKTFREKYKIQAFHTSECVHRNRKSDFASWEDSRVDAAVAGVRRITMKYGVLAISFAVTKADFDAEMPEAWKDFIGRDHYVWAVWHLLTLLRQWSNEHAKSKIEFVFDYLEGKPRAAVEKALADMETRYPGVYEGHYSFRNRREWAGLQCADLLVWSCLAAARLTFERTPIHPVAEKTILEYRKFRNGEWISALAISRRELRRSIQKHLVPFLRRP